MNDDDDDDDLAYSYVKLLVKLVRVSVCSNSKRFYYSNFETQIFLRMITDVDCHYKMKIMVMIMTLKIIMTIIIIFYHSGKDYAEKNRGMTRGTSNDGSTPLRGRTFKDISLLVRRLFI